MDFDEYEYLEKTVENPQAQKEEETANGSDGTLKSEEKHRSRSSKHRRDEKRDDNDDDSSSKHRRDEKRDDNDDDSSHRSKRSRSGDESRSRHHSRSRDAERRPHSSSRDGERDTHRSSREHRDKERDRDRDRDRDREERNGKEREKDRDKDRDRKERDRERERDRDKDRDRESRRSRSRSERHRSDRDEDRERSREREHREKDGEKDSKERDKESRRHKEKKEEKVEPEADPERDQRTVFAYQIALKATERDVYEFFSRAGKVRDVRLIMDRISRRSRGIGYVEFYDAVSVPMAIALSGQPLLGQPVMVKPSEAEKNLVQSTTTGSGGLMGPYSGGARRLYVGNLHVNMTEDDLRKVFEPFGTVELVQLPRDETGHCKGFGFVQFARLEDARNALNLNGQLEIAGRAIKVSAVTDQTGEQEAGQTQTTGDLDDDDGGGMLLNAQSRALLMQKLDRSTTASSTGLTTAAAIPGAASVISPLVAPLIQGSVPAVAGLPGTGLLPGANVPAAIDTIGIPSECLLLKNMFDPKTETEPDFDLDIKEDVQDECSKFGKLKHIYVEKNSAGFVYLRFENVQSAMSAQRALHGRWFAGNMILANFMTPQTYEAKFPDSNH